MADAMDVIRVKLDMRRSNPVSSELVWMAVVPSEVTTVKQLAKLLKQRFLLDSRHKLYLDGAWLPPVESIRVLRDNDLLSVVREETCGPREFSPDAKAQVVQNGGVKRQFEEPILLPPKKKKKNKKPRCQSLSVQEPPAEFSVGEDQAAAAPTKPHAQTTDLQTAEDRSSCDESEAVVKSQSESRLQSGFDTTAGLVPDPSLLTTPSKPKKKRPRKRKKKPKVAASVEPTVEPTPAVVGPLRVSVEPKGKHKRFDHESHWDQTENEEARQKQADDGEQGEADDGGQEEAEDNEAFAPDDCSTPVLQKMLMDRSRQMPPAEKSQEWGELQLYGFEHAGTTGKGAGDFRAVPPPPGLTPRTAPEKKIIQPAATAETATRPEPQTATRCYADLPKLKTPPRVGEMIAFKVLELDANYCPNVSEYKEGKVLSHNMGTDMLRIELRVPEVKATYNGKFELEVQEEDEVPPVEELVELQWSELLEPVLLSS